MKTSVAPKVFAMKSASSFSASTMSGLWASEISPVPVLSMSSPSRATISATSSTDPFWLRQKVCVSARPNFFSILLQGIFDEPMQQKPPFRPEAPQPISARSSTTA